MKQIRKRLTYANVMSTIAVFLLLGGATAFAASQLPKNSVGSKQIKKNAVNSAKVKNHSLKAVDFKAGQLPAGAQGPPGPKGDTGDTGPKGETGAPGSALAYAHVLYSAGIASFDSTQTHGMGSATVTATGLGGFCFSNLPFTARNATASIDWTNGTSEEDTAQISIVSSGTVSGCSTGDLVRVETINANTATEEHSSFYITFN